MSVDTAKSIACVVSTIKKSTGITLEVADHTIITDDDRRNRLVRIYLKSVDSDDFPATIILKQPAADYDPLATESKATDAFFNEWAALDFLNRDEVDHHETIVPKFYGGNRELGFFLMEDLGDEEEAVLVNQEMIPLGVSLVQPLLGKNPKIAEQSLIDWSTKLAKLHGCSLGKSKAYFQIRNSLSKHNQFGPDAQLKSFKELITKEIPSTLEVLKLPYTKLPFAKELESELKLVHDIISDPGDYYGLTHGDPCPDNCSGKEQQFRLIDFEFSAFRHILLDAVYPRIGFPTCWCSSQVPLNTALLVEQHYRKKLTKTCEAAKDDHSFNLNISVACAFWSIWELGTLKNALKEDQDWALASRRQRILMRLKALHATTEQLGQLPALNAFSRDLLTGLSKIWAPDNQLSIFPAWKTY